MKFAYAITYVTNVDETLSFYERAFGFQRKFITPEKDYGELISGETTISFASLELAKSNFSQPIDSVENKANVVGVEFAFTSENIDADFAKAIEAGAKIFEQVKQKPWGQKVGYLLDLNGFLIEVCTPINQE